MEREPPYDRLARKGSRHLTKPYRLKASGPPNLPFEVNRQSRSMTRASEESRWRSISDDRAGHQNAFAPARGSEHGTSELNRPSTAQHSCCFL